MTHELQPVTPKAKEGCFSRILKVVGALALVSLACGVIATIGNMRNGGTVAPTSAPAVALVATEAITPTVTLETEPTATDGPTPTPTNSPEPTNTPLPTDTPEPTSTPTPLPPAPPFSEIRANMEGMTDAQWDAYKRSLGGLRAIEWSGWVSDVSEKLFGGYQLLVDMDSPNELSVQDVTFDISDDIALELSKDTKVTFSGTIDSANNIFGSLQINMSDATVEAD